MTFRRFPIAQPRWPLRRPLLLLSRTTPSPSQGLPAQVVHVVVLATVTDARMRMVDGIMAVRLIHFINGISSAITVRYIETDTGQQVGGEFSGGPAAEVSLTGTAVEYGARIRIEYKTDTSASGYSDVTTWRTLSTVVMLDGEEEPVLYVPQIYFDPVP
jgi:hypothetical protein